MFGMIFERWRNIIIVLIVVAATIKIGRALVFMRCTVLQVISQKKKKASKQIQQGHDFGS